MNWLDYKEKLSKLSNKEKGDSFELLTKHYLRFDPKFSSKLKNVWLLKEVPHSISIKLNLPLKDFGIDIICETKQSEFWSVQCKYSQNEDLNTTWKEISTFLSLSSQKTKNISHLILSTTKNGIVEILEDVKLGLITGSDWRNLPSAFFKSFNQSDKKYKPTAKKPYPHQKEAIQNSCNHFLENDERLGKLIMPCGTGKTLTSYWIDNSVGSDKTLFLAPSLTLIRQTLNEWLGEYVALGIPVNWLVVCSDQSIQLDENLDIKTQSIGVPVTTDIDEISSWLRQKSKSKKIVFCTYQSSEKLCRAAKIEKFSFDIGIFDEAHRTVGDKGRLFSKPLFDKNIMINKRLFMTATEKRFRGKSEKIISMDQPERYGFTVFEMSFKEAIEKKMICDYKVVTFFVDKDEVANLIWNTVFVRPNKGKWSNDLEAKMLATIITLKKSMISKNISHAITFHSTISRAETFMKNLTIYDKTQDKALKSKNFFVSGSQNSFTREKVISEFKSSDLSVLSNARCLTEGVDIPNVDCVIFSDPKKSKVDITQTIGRALRSAKDKKFAYILIPIISKGEFFNIADSPEYQNIIDLISALGTIDERIAEYFNTIVNNSKNSMSSKKENFIFEFDEKLKEKINLNEFKNHIRLQTSRRLNKLAWASFEDASYFAKRLKLKSIRQWKEYCKGDREHEIERPFNIPSSPQYVYKNKGWKGFPEFLGYVIRQNIKKMSYKSAKKYVHNLKFKSSSEYFKWSKKQVDGESIRPLSMPGVPTKFYKSEWKGWGDYLGKSYNPRITGKPYYNYDEAKNIVNKEKLKNSNQFVSWLKVNRFSFEKNIPSNPKQFYGDKFEGWNVFLGPSYCKIRIKTKKYLSLSESKKIVKKLNIKSSKDWDLFTKSKKFEPLKEKGVTHNPYIYNNDPEWKGLPDYLGYKKITNKNKYVSYEEAEKYVRGFNFIRAADYLVYYSKNLFSIDLPKYPEHHYARYGGKWKNWYEFLGKKK